MLSLAEQNKKKIKEGYIASRITNAQKIIMDNLREL